MESTVPTGQLFLLALALLLLGIASTGVSLRIYQGAIGIGRILPVLVSGVIACNLGLLVWRSSTAGVLAALGQAFGYTVLLATILVLIVRLAATHRDVFGLDGFVLPIAMVVELCAFLSVTDVPQALDSPTWFVVHHVSLVLSIALFICGGVAGGVYIGLSRIMRRKRPSLLLGHLSPLETWERQGRRFTVAGFGLFTFGILTGICEMAQQPASQAAEWASDWLIIACFIVWVLYAATLVATFLVPSLRGRRVALLTVGSGSVLTIVFLVIGAILGGHR